VQKPIGVFDSGIGGLTVLREIVRAMPGQSLVFLGDTARVPYGSRGRDVIRQFALDLAAFMTARDVQYMVAACNTISSTCLDELQDSVGVPVLGVVEPAVREAVRVTRTGRIGVIGTRATVGSGFYEAQLKRLQPDLDVVSQACPLFVPLAEEGMLDAEATRLIAGEYLKPFAGSDIDVLILGCTHYPLLRSVIQSVVGDGVCLVDSAAPTATELATQLEAPTPDSENAPTYELFVTDAPERVNTVARLFFGDDLPADLQKVTIKST
jgi:glutamate racemase